MKPITLETSAKTTEVIRYPLRLSTKLIYFINDSATYDMRVNFDASTDENGAFTLKAGEILDDVPMDCSSVSFKGIGGVVPFRVMGV